jgi:hypothetical protein
MNTNQIRFDTSDGYADNQIMQKTNKLIGLGLGGIIIGLG